MWHITNTSQAFTSRAFALQDITYTTSTALRHHLVKQTLLRVGHIKRNFTISSKGEWFILQLAIRLADWLPTIRLLTVVQDSFLIEARYVVVSPYTKPLKLRPIITYKQAIGEGSHDAMLLKTDKLHEKPSDCIGVDLVT